MITCLGDIFLDLHVRRVVTAGSRHTAEPMAATPGGAAANTAAWLARLGSAAGIIGSVGADLVGAALSADLRRRGVRTAVSRVTGMATGICMVMHELDGGTSVTARRGANDVLRLDARQRRLVFSSSWLHISAYAFFAEESRALVVRAAELARSNGAPVSVDLGAPHLVRHVGPAEYLRLLQAVHPRVLFANEAEAALLSGAGDPVDSIAALAELAVLKRGAAGCIVHDGRSRTVLDAVPAEEVDATGAGDAFAAGTISCLAAGGSLFEAARAGAALGAACVMVVGGYPAASHA